jgi:hypothetical protein
MEHYTMSTLADRFKYISDPGHGWLQVNWTDLQALSLKPKSFSRYSYRRGNTFYLEEDCDAAVFVEAYKAQHGRMPELIEEYQERTFIRGLPRIW